MADEDDILAQVKRTLAANERKAATQAEEPKKKPPVDVGTTIGNIIQEVTSGEKTIDGTKHWYTNVKSACKWLWATKLVRAVRAICRGVTFAYRAAWHATDSKKYKYKSVRWGAKAGRVILLAMTAGVATQGLRYTDHLTGKIGDDIADLTFATTLEPVYDTARMSVYGVKTEKLCLNHVNEADKDNGVYSATGNHISNSTEVDGDNTLYLVTKRSLIHQAWSIAHGHGTFDPNVFMGPLVNGGSQAYEVTHYAHRWMSPILPSILHGNAELLHVKRLDGDKSCSVFNTVAPKGQPAAPGQQAPAPATQSTPQP